MVVVGMEWVWKRDCLDLWLDLLAVWVGVVVVRVW